MAHLCPTDASASSPIFGARSHISIRKTHICVCGNLRLYVNFVLTSYKGISTIGRNEYTKPPKIRGGITFLGYRVMNIQKAPMTFVVKFALREKFEAEARREGMTLSAWLNRAIELALPEEKPVTEPRETAL